MREQGRNSDRPGALIVTLRNMRTVHSCLGSTTLSPSALPLSLPPDSWHPPVVCSVQTAREWAVLTFREVVQYEKRTLALAPKSQVPLGHGHPWIIGATQ